MYMFIVVFVRILRRFILEKEKVILIFGEFLKVVIIYAVLKVLGSSWNEWVENKYERNFREEKVFGNFGVWRSFFVVLRL